jgi:outer membrane protein OmpA-like peptidoglycan-associated protein
MRRFLSLIFLLAVAVLSVGVFGALYPDVRIFVMPGGNVYGDGYGWSATGGISLESRSGIPWSLGLWGGYSSVQQTGLTSAAYGGGLMLGLPLSIPGVTFVPLVFGGGKMDNLGGGASNYNVPAATVEPGLEIRFDFLLPFEIGLYAGYSMDFYQNFTSKNLHCGLSLALDFVDRTNTTQPAMKVHEDNQPAVVTNMVTVTVTNYATNQSPSQADFAREIQADLTAGPTNAVSTTNTGTSTSTSMNTNTNMNAISNQNAVSPATNTNIAPTAVTNDATPALETKKDELDIRFSEVLFDKGSAEPAEQTLEIIHNLASTFKKYPKLQIMVEGHTDNQGDRAFNLDLSERRAKAVTEELIRNGVSSNQLRYQGFGDQKPVAPNDTETNRKKNRRVNIRVLFTEEH